MSELSVSFDGPLNAEAWRIMAGSTVCETCGSPIALFTVCEEDADGWPISERPTGEKRWTELVDPPEFGTEHTAARCREVRAGTVVR